MSYTKVADQTREMKEATFLKKVQQKEQKAKHICWCVAPCDLYNIWHIDILSLQTILYGELENP